MSLPCLLTLILNPPLTRHMPIPLSPPLLLVSYRNNVSQSTHLPQRVFNMFHAHTFAFCPSILATKKKRVRRAPPSDYMLFPNSYILLYVCMCECEGGKRQRRSEFGNVILCTSSWECFSVHVEFPATHW